MITDQTQYDEYTLYAVYQALEELGIEDRVQLDIVTAIQNKGIIFRERVGNG